MENTHIKNNMENKEKKELEENIDKEKKKIKGYDELQLEVDKLTGALNKCLEIVGLSVTDPTSACTIYYNNSGTQLTSSNYSSSGTTTKPTCPFRTCTKPRSLPSGSGTARLRSCASRRTAPCGGSCTPT